MSQIGALFGGLFGDAGLNFVNEAGGKKKVFGGKPEVAPFIPLDLTAEQKKALEGNLANASTIEALLNRLVPGFSSLIKKGTENSMALLSGEIPKDVQDQIYRSSAFQSLQGGFQGSGMSKSLTARDLGRTSLDLQQAGANSAQQWAKLAESSYSPFIIDPAQQASATAANNAGEQATKQFQYNVDAAPDPGAAGVFNLNTALGMQMLSFGMGAAGGAFGGGGSPAPAAPQGGTYNYAGTSGGTNWQYNPTTGQYAPILRATWGGG